MIKHIFQLIIICILSLCSFSYHGGVLAQEDESEASPDMERLELLTETLENYNISYLKNIAFGSPFTIDISPLQDITKEGFSDASLRFEWKIEGEIVEESSILNYNFENAGQRSIELLIYGEIGETEAIIYSSDIEVFVFSEAMVFVVEEVMKEDFQEFQSLAKNKGILVRELGFLREDQLKDIDFGNLYLEFKSRYPLSSDYMTVLGSKEFSMSFLRLGNIENVVENIVILSSYNRTLFREYFRNSFSGMSVSWSAFLLSDIHMQELLRHPIIYSDLKQHLQQNDFNILDLRFDMRNNPLFFLSSQLQYLGKYLTQSELYLLLLIPFFITAVSISKHLIGINTLGIIIPVFLTYLMIDIGLIEILILFSLLGVINIGIAQYLNRYALLYTPKISFLLICNILIYFLIAHLLHYFDIGSIEIHSLIAFIFFIIISERFLVIVTSKELPEYSASIIGTLILALLLTLISQIDLIRVVLFSYPELILLLLPLNFSLAKFTGLRFTEYLRFREVMRDIEE